MRVIPVQSSEREGLANDLSFSSCKIIHIVKELDVARALLDAASLEHSFLSGHHDLWGKLGDLPKQPGIVNVAGHVGRDEPI